MLQVYQDVKAFILSFGNNAFKKAGLDEVAEKNIVFGMIDASRNVSSVVIAINPESAEVAETTLGGWSEKRTINIAVAVRGAPYDVLMQKMCGYAECLRRLFMDDTSVGGTRSDTDVGETRYFPDCGVAPLTMTGAEIDLTLYSIEEHGVAVGDSLTDLFD